MMTLTNAQIEAARDVFLENGIEFCLPWLGDMDDLDRERYDALRLALEAALSGSPQVEAGTWQDDPSADERWNAGCDFAMLQLCSVVGADPKKVMWDSATETLDGDVQSTIGKIIEAGLGENWQDRAHPAPRPADGWKLVPVEPTDEMADKGDNYLPQFVPGADGCRPDGDDIARDVYRAMLQAAPTPPAASGDEWNFDMSAAPSDGTDILAFCDGVGMGQMVLYWLDGYWREKANGMGLKRVPIAWRPLPTPPASTSPTNQNGE